MVQSMLNTDTMNTEACVEQAIRIIEAGGKLVRITAPGVKEARNLENIHAELRRRGYTTPLSADIHFNPEAAIEAARHVEKVRINPGNFVDKRATFKTLTYTDEEYAAELERLREKFSAFLNVCREYGTAVRIGTNHGSLSDRIMSRYGNTPAGMVEATMEYLRVCRDEKFDDVVISLKSSDCRVMVEAVRLLVKEMEKEGMDYPLHLGVTEAGEGEDGRIRSAVGIGTLLNEGLGDTIRVSLTEEPEQEIPVANLLNEICCLQDLKTEPMHLEGRYSHPVIVADISKVECLDEAVMAGLDFHVATENDPVYGDMLKGGMRAPEMIYTEALGPELTKLPDSVTVVVPFDSLDIAHVYNRKAVALIDAKDFVRLSKPVEGDSIFVEVRDGEMINTELAGKLEREKNAIVVLKPDHPSCALFRLYLGELKRLGIMNRVIVRATLDESDSNRLSLGITLLIYRAFTKICSMETTIIFPCVLAFCVIGVYALNSNLDDVWIMLFFGVIGYILSKFKFPMATLLIGFILSPLFEKNFRRALILNSGDWSIFFSSPLCWLFWAATILSVFFIVRGKRKDKNLQDGL